MRLLGSLLLLTACSREDATESVTATESGADTLGISSSSAATQDGPIESCEPYETTALPPTAVDMGTTGACQGHATVDDCCCFDAAVDYPAVACATESPCAPIELSCPADNVIGCSDDVVVPCSAAVDCALRALAARQPARLHWQIESSELPGFSEIQVTLHLQDDGTAYRTGYRRFDLGASQDTPERLTVKPPEFFKDCLMDPSPARRFVCIQNAFTGQPLETCATPPDVGPFWVP